MEAERNAAKDENMDSEENNEEEVVEVKSKNYSINDIMSMDTLNLTKKKKGKLNKQESDNDMGITKAISKKREKKKKQCKKS